MATTSALWNLIVRSRRIFVVGVHIGLIVFSNWLAFWLRFDGRIPAAHWELCWQMMPALVLIRGIIFIPFRLYEGLWRYTGIWDLRNIIAAVGTSSLVFFGTIQGLFGLAEYPRSVIAIDSLLLIFFMGGIRLARRLYQVTSTLSSRKRLLIYGAGDTGEMIVRDIRNNGHEYDYNPIGFVDDDRQKVGRRIHGIRVLGGGDDLPKIILREKPDEILLAVHRAEAAAMRKLVTTLAPFKIPIRTLPALQNGDRKGPRIAQIRDLAIEDLLERLPVGLDSNPLREFVKGRRVVITGAGGSIGSELCRQIAGFGPELLIMIEKSESALYTIDQEIAHKFPALNKQPMLININHLVPLEKLFRAERPQVVFHAAAYKHVPMMELHPGEAVLNNIIGTHRLCQISVQNKVDKFILISTDKAVNPTNIMGATKRACEILVQSLSKHEQQGKTAFSAVRFGNVLGSSGSVVPLFREQIERGGPVTVTHPEISRYFMTIPEAVQLVLHAATLAQGGDIFVLEMGEQVKLLDMAKNLIRIAGFVPEKEMPITFVGLRPGEKLREELVGMDEVVSASPVDKIMRVQSGWIPDLESLTHKISALEQAAVRGKLDEVLRLLFEVVPTFRPLDPRSATQVVYRVSRELPKPNLALIKPVSPGE